MPRDVVYSTATESLPTGSPLVLYLPADARPDDLLALELDRRRVTRLRRAAAAAVPTDKPLDTRITLRGSGVGLAGRDEPGQYGVGVHWTRGGGFVQLGPTGRFHSGDEALVPGSWVDLDWSQTNRLVKFLRNARDQAFGRPE